MKWQKKLLHFVFIKCILITFKIYQSGVSYLVVSGKRKAVVGRYINLEQAKDILHQISKEGGERMIAEVHGRDSVQKDPHYISGKPQKEYAGFKKSWGDWSGIHRMLDISEKFLKNITGELKKYISFQRTFELSD